MTPAIIATFFNGHTVRYVKAYSHIWVVAADAATALDYKNANSSTVSGRVHEEFTTRFPGLGERSMTCVRLDALKYSRTIPPRKRGVFQALVKHIEEHCGQTVGVSEYAQEPVREPAQTELAMEPEEEAALEDRAVNVTKGIGAIMECEWLTEEEKQACKDAIVNGFVKG